MSPWEYTVAGSCPDQSFLSLCHQRRVAGLSMLFKVHSNNNHCLFSEFPSASTRVRYTLAAAAAHQWNLKYQGVEGPHFLCLSCRLGFECGMTFPIYTVFDTGKLDGFKGALNRWLLPRVVFSSVFRGADDCGVAKQFFNSFVFLTSACYWF